MVAGVNWARVGGESINTNIYKYGTGSLLIPAFGGLLGHSNLFAFGVGDFTLECWANFIDSGRNQGIIQICSNANGMTTDYTQYVSLSPGGGGCYGGWAGGSYFNFGKYSIDAWTHMAIVRLSGVTSMYINGVSEYTKIDTLKYTGTYCRIGNYYDGNYPANVYIDELCISNHARYTSNFTPNRIYSDYTIFEEQNNKIYGYK